MSFKTTLLFLFTILIFQACLTAQKGEEKSIAVDKEKLLPDTLAAMDAHFKELIDRKRLAGAQTLIYRKGEIEHFKSFGFASIEEEIELDSQSIFRIFSMTKPIVSVALMQLVEQGKLNLEDPISRFVPAFKNCKRFNEDGEKVECEQEILIIDLLRHTSGLGYGRGPNASANTAYRNLNWGEATDGNEYLEMIAELPLAFNPGDNWEYGISTNVIGHLIELISGQDLNTYLAENIFRPLKMRHTYFQLPKEEIQHFTTGYRANDDGTISIAESRTDNRYINEVSLYNGGGGLVSTTLDYLQFCKMILNKGMVDGKIVLKKETVELMTKDHMGEIIAKHPDTYLPRNETGFGLGFAINERNGKLDFGWGGAVGTYFRINPKEELINIMMIQISPYRHLNLRSIFQSYVYNSIIN